MMNAPGTKLTAGRCPVGMNRPADTSVAVATRPRKEVTFMARYVTGNRGYRTGMGYRTGIANRVWME